MKINECLFFGHFYPSLTTQPARDLTNYFKFVFISTIYAYNLTNLTSTPLLCRTAEYIWMFQDTQVLSTPSIPEIPVMVVFYHITQRSAEKIFVVDMSRMIIGHIKSSVF